MNKYVIITTLCNNEEIANKIISNLLDKKLIAGSQLSKVHSKYWWNNELEECREYKLEFRSKMRLFEEIKEEIRKIHDYDVCEITATEIINANKEIYDWIDDNVGNNIVSI